MTDEMAIDHLSRIALFPKRHRVADRGWSGAIENTTDRSAAAERSQREVADASPQEAIAVDRGSDLTEERPLRPVTAPISASVIVFHRSGTPKRSTESWRSA